MGNSKSTSALDWVISKEHILGIAKGALPIILTGASAMLAVVPVLGAQSPGFWLLFWFALAMYLVAIVLSFVVWHLDKGIRSSSTIDMAKLAALRKAVMSSLVIYADKLKNVIFDSPHVRITIYGYDKEADVFIPVMRRCRNPDLQALHRDSYPRAEGLISQVWQSGSGSFECLAKKDLQAKLRQQHLEETGINGRTYDDLPMKPFSMIGVALLRENDTYGVIILESDSQDVNIAHGLDTLRNHPSVEDITRLVSDTRTMLRDLRDDQEYNTHTRADYIS